MKSRRKIEIETKIFKAIPGFSVLDRRRKRGRRKKCSVEAIGEDVDRLKFRAIRKLLALCLIQSILASFIISSSGFSSNHMKNLTNISSTQSSPHLNSTANELDDQLEISRNPNLPGEAVSEAPERGGTYSMRSNNNNSNSNKQFPMQEANRFARSAKSRADASGQSAANSIEASLGHRLLVPCTNLTIHQPEQPALVATSGAGPSAKRQRLRQQQQQTKSQTNGQGISVIVWHKDDQFDSPIFTVDARGVNSLRAAKQQTHADDLLGRASFVETGKLEPKNGFGSTPALVIEEARASDAGLYRCTVEFYQSPTQTYDTRVQLIKPPKNMIIRNQGGRISNSFAGPYDEDSSVELSCEAEPGEPAGNVSWWKLNSSGALSSTKSPFQLVQQGSSSQATSDFDPRLVTVAFEQMAPVNEMHQLDDYPNLVIRDYFVALKSGIGHSLTAGSDQLPFNESLTQRFRLRHWVRVQDQTTASSMEKISSTIQIGQLTRFNDGDEYLCLAGNSKENSLFLNETIRIDLNLKPVEVKIVNKFNSTMRANQKHMIECQALGSKPLARIKWFKGGQELIGGEAGDVSASLEQQPSSNSSPNNYIISELNRDNKFYNYSKISYLTLNPQIGDNQQSLTCTAVNPKLPNSPTISDSLIMNVNFPAQLDLRLGAGLKPNSIELGKDVFMDCSVQANPPIDDFAWLFNDRPLVQNVSAGIIMSNQSLGVQRIKIEHSGQYQCMAHNSLGTAYSNKLHLRPEFGPICDYSITKTRYEVALNQPVRIECNVLAEPSDDIEFQWKFNQTKSSEWPSSSSGDIYDVNQQLRGSSSISGSLRKIDKFETNFTKSYLMFTPQSKRDYGQLICTASNSIGRQESACLIDIIPSGLPEPVFGCFISNVTNNSFNVNCQSRSEMRQNYILELYANSNNKLSGGDLVTQANILKAHLKQQTQNYLNESLPLDEQQQNSNENGPNEENQLNEMREWRSDDPAFFIDNLEPDTNYNIMIYVQNFKGRSQPASYQATTLPAIEGSHNRLQVLNKRQQEQHWTAANSTSAFGGAQTPFIGPLLKGVFSLNLASGLDGGNGGVINGMSQPRAAGIATLILLCALSIVLVTFLVSRLICGSSRKSSVSSDALEKSSSKTIAAPAKTSENVLSDINKQQHSNDDKLFNRLAADVDRSMARQKTHCGPEEVDVKSGPRNLTRNGVDYAKRQLASAPSRSCQSRGAPLALKGLLPAGSGSDTSHETNTDSTTLFSSLTTAKTNIPSNQTNLDPLEGDDEGEATGNRRTEAPLTASVARFNRAQQFQNLMLANGQLAIDESNYRRLLLRQQQQQQQPTSGLRHSSSGLEPEGAGPAENCRGILRNANQANCYVSGNYCSASLQRTVRGSDEPSPLAYDQRLSNTPQISLISNLSDAAQVPDRQQQQQLSEQPILFKYGPNDFSEPIYVLNRNGNVNGQHCLNSNDGDDLQIHLQFEPTNLWPNYAPPDQRRPLNELNSTSAIAESQKAAGSEFYSLNRTRAANASDGNNCRLIGRVANLKDLRAQQQFAILPSSSSIPVALSDCLHLNHHEHRFGQRHHMSQEFLAQDFACNATNQAQAQMQNLIHPNHQLATNSNCQSLMLPPGCAIDGQRETSAEFENQMLMSRDHFCEQQIQVIDNVHDLEEEREFSVNVEPCSMVAGEKDLIDASEISPPANYSSSFAADWSASCNRQNFSKFDNQRQRFMAEAGAASPVEPDQIEIERQRQHYCIQTLDGQHQQQRGISNRVAPTASVAQSHIDDSSRSRGQANGS